MNDSGIQNIIDRIEAMAVQGPYTNNLAELDAWLRGYKEAQEGIIALLRSMMDGR